MRLLIAFVLVSLIPILVLAALSLREAAAEPVDPAAGSGPAGSGEQGMLGGVPLEIVELSVAGSSLLLAVGTALYVGRTIIRPLRQLEATMHQVESGDLDIMALVKRDDEIGHLAAAFNRMVSAMKREVEVFSAEALHPADASPIAGSPAISPASAGG